MSWSPGEPEQKRTKRQLKANSINGYTWPQEKMRPDTLDKFIGVLKKSVAVAGCLPGLWKVESCVSERIFSACSITECKADIDAAFRRIPVKPAHRWTSGIAFKVNGKVRVCIVSLCTGM